jgi:phosphoglucosamine mutase
VAPAAYRAAGADVIAIHATPDGLNINDGCGSTHLSKIKDAVLAHGAAVGLAHDGDADRCLAVDRGGRLVNGDCIVALLALDRQSRGELPDDRVVVTSMTNLGFHDLMRRSGIVVEVTDVGDRYVLERMLSTGAALGGEQSGHIIDLTHHTTGDGLATALMLLGAMDRLGMAMEDVADLITPYPQRLVGVRADRGLLASADRVWQEVDAVSANLGEHGRVIVRASGTEPLVRVMVEARDPRLCDLLCDRLAEVVRREIGIGEEGEG